jgi:hypothetical protein
MILLVCIITVACVPRYALKQWTIFRTYKAGLVGCDASARSSEALVRRHNPEDLDLTVKPHMSHHV